MATRERVIEERLDPYVHVDDGLVQVLLLF